MEAWDAMKAEGIALADRQRHLRKVLALAWPKLQRWDYRCDRCNDYGLIMLDCPRDHTCGRSRPHLPHEYGVPCHCAKGAKFVAKQKAAEDYTSAGKKPRQLTRVGR